jgi:hypothetical protein
VPYPPRERAKKGGLGRTPRISGYRSAGYGLTRPPLPGIRLNKRGGLRWDADSIQVTNQGKYEAPTLEKLGRRAPATAARTNHEREKSEPPRSPRRTWGTRPGCQKLLTLEYGGAVFFLDIPLYRNRQTIHAAELIAPTISHISARTRAAIATTGFRDSFFKMDLTKIVTVKTQLTAIIANLRLL